jgi:WD40 repeat protein
VLLPYLTIFLLGQNPSLASERATEPLARCQAAIRDPIDAIAFLKSPQVLAVHQRGAPIELLAWEKGRKSTSQVLEATRATDVVFSPNGEVCAFYQDDKIKLWNLSRNVLEKSVGVPHSAVPHTLGLSADGEFMAIAVDEPGPQSQEAPQNVEDRRKFRIYVVRVASGQTIANLSGYMGPVPSIAFSNNGKMIAAGTAYARDAPVFVWDLPKATRLAELKGQAEICSTVAFSPDDSLLATASGVKRHGTVRLWDRGTPSTDVAVGWDQTA